MDAGNPIFGAYSDKDRALPGPSPTANLAGVWKGKRLKFKPLFAGGFLFSTFPATLERRVYDTSRKSNLKKSNYALLFCQGNICVPNSLS